jgi:hypothetical protein
MKHNPIPTEHCIACLQPFTVNNGKQKTDHHVWPQRFFGGDGPILKLCRACHNEIDAVLPPGVALEPSVYAKIHDDWLYEKHANLTTA